MKANTYSLAILSDLAGEMRRESEESGLPQLRQQLSPSPLKGLVPLSQEEARICYEESNSEFDALEQHLADSPLPPPGSE